MIDNTPIKFERINEKDEYVSSYGKVASVNPDLLEQQTFARAPCDKAYFEPGEDNFYTYAKDWCCPLIELGHLAWRTKVRVFTLPEEIGNLFTTAEGNYVDTIADTEPDYHKKLHYWLKSLRSKPNQLGLHTH